MHNFVTGMDIDVNYFEYGYIEIALCHSALPNAVIDEIM